MRPLSANVLERIVTGSQEGVPGQVARRMSKHLAAEKRLESREKEREVQDNYLNNCLWDLSWPRKEARTIEQ